MARFILTQLEDGRPILFSLDHLKKASPLQIQLPGKPPGTAIVLSGELTPDNILLPFQALLSAIDATLEGTGCESAGKVHAVLSLSVAPVAGTGKN